MFASLEFVWLVVVNPITPIIAAIIESSKAIAIILKPMLILLAISYAPLKSL
jgi:hypothetical protein